VLLRRLARPLFASWFVSEGLQVLRHPAPHAERASGALTTLRRRLPDGSLGGALDEPPSDRQLLTLSQVHGAALVVAGAALAVGRAPRTAALVLAVLTAPLVVADAVQLAEDRGDPSARRARRERLVRTLAFTGGAVLVGADYEGRPGVRWRVSDARDRHARAAADAARAVADAAKKVVD